MLLSDLSVGRLLVKLCLVASLSPQIRGITFANKTIITEMIDIENYKEQDLDGRVTEKAKKLLEQLQHMKHFKHKCQASTVFMTGSLSHCTFVINKTTVL